MKNVIENLSNNLKKGQFGYSVLTLTEPKMNKRGNSLYGRVTKVTTYLNAKLGTSYENSVNQRNERLNNRAEKIELGFTPYKHYNDFFNTLKSNEYAFYLKLNSIDKASIKSFYLVDGRRATSEETDYIKQFLPKRKESVGTQEKIGLEAQDQVKVNCVKLENVLQIKQGKKRIYLKKKDWANIA